MKLYAELPAIRTRQVLTDVAVLAWVLLWTRVGLWMDELVNRLATPGMALERAGADFARPLRDAGREVADIPVVGDALQGPLDAAADAGRVLARAGANQQDVVGSLALWLGWLFALLPISLLLIVYLPGRLRWLRESSAGRRLRAEGSLELFALRAAATRPLPELAQASADPAGDLRAGRFGALASLELRALGLRTETVPGRSPSDPSAEQ